MKCIDLQIYNKNFPVCWRHALVLFETRLHRIMKPNKEMHNKYFTISIPEYIYETNGNSEHFSNKGIYESAIRHPYLHIQLT